MAKYRQVETQFWSDGFVLDLTPEEKYFYLYLMTNSKTTQCGIFELPKRIIETETGYNRDTVDKLLQRFTEYGKIQYCNETKEIMILNWIKYNQPNNANAVKCVNKELKSIKDKRFINVFYLQCKKEKLDIQSIFEGVSGTYKGMVSPLQGATKGIGRVCFRKNEINDDKFIKNDESEENQQVTDLDKPLTRGLVGHCKGLPSNKVISNKEEVISNKQKIKSNSSSNKEKEESNYKVRNNECVENNNTPIVAAGETDLENIIAVFENNIHPMVPMEHEKIMDWSGKVNSDLIVMAIEEAVSNNVRNMRYIEKILYAWLSNGITTINGLESYKKEWEKQKKIDPKNGSVDQWNYSGQRSYDYDELEKNLLGIHSTEDEECGEEVGVNTSEEV